MDLGRARIGHRLSILIGAAGPKLARLFQNPRLFGLLHALEEQFFFSSWTSIAICHPVPSYGSVNDKVGLSSWKTYDQNLNLPFACFLTVIFFRLDPDPCTFELVSPRMSESSEPNRPALKQIQLPVFLIYIDKAVKKKNR